MAKSNTLRVAAALAVIILTAAATSAWPTTALKITVPWDREYFCWVGPGIIFVDGHVGKDGHVSDPLSRFAGHSVHGP